MIKPASFGSISHGTLRTEDLLEAFASELEGQILANGDYFSRPENFSERDALNNLHGEALDQWNEDGETLADEDSAQDLVAELQDALNEFAPPYGYFGAHPGDCSDFGYWLSESIEDDFDGLKVDDTSEVPDDYNGEVLHVNDHGNMTLYSAVNGELTEVWGIV